MKKVFPYFVSILAGIMAAILGLIIINDVTNLLYIPATDNLAIHQSVLFLFKQKSWFLAFIGIINYFIKPLFIFCLVQLLFWLLWIRKLNK